MAFIKNYGDISSVIERKKLEEVSNLQCNFLVIIGTLANTYFVNVRQKRMAKQSHVMAASKTTYQMKLLSVTGTAILFAEYV